MKLSFALTRLLSALMVVGALILASCSSTSQSPAASPTASTPPTATAPKTPTPLPKPTGSLTIAADIGAGVFDPKFGTPRGYMTTGFRVFDLLIEPDPDGRPSPGIAEKWEFSKDGLSHTFYIRKGVKFHDGSDLTGADVKFSLDRILASDSRHPDSATWRTQIDSIELKDEWTVVVKMKQPIWELIQGFNNYGGSTAVVPKKYIEAKGDDYFGKNPIGSGPYKVTKIEIGNRMQFEAVDSHWKETAKFKNITAVFVNEEATIVAMLKTGELDVAGISADSVTGVKSAGLRTLDWDGGAQAWQFVFWDANNPKDYAISDVRVRKALSLGINREEMADKLYSGYARPSVAFRVLPSAYFFDPNVLKADPFDPEGAKKLMAEAGYANGFNLKYWEMGAGGPMSTINNAMAGYWRKIGVNVELVPRAYDTTLFLPTQKPEVWGTVWGNITAGGVFNFEAMLTSYHSKRSSAKNNTNAKLDAILEKVPLTADPAEQKKLALEAALMAKNEYTALPIIDVRSIVAMGSKVGGLTPIKGMGTLSPAYQSITGK